MTSMATDQYIVSISSILILGEDQHSLLIKKGDRELLLEFDDPDDLALVTQILTRSSSPILLVDLLPYFNRKEEDIKAIVAQLMELKLLRDCTHSELEDFVIDPIFQAGLDNHLWRIDLTKSDFLQFSQGISINIIGLNSLAILVADLLKKSGFSNIRLVDSPYLRGDYVDQDIVHPIDSFENFFSNYHKDENKNHLAVIAADSENIPALLQLNDRLAKERITFFTLFILGENGYMGPLVVPGKTSCLRCAIEKMENNKGQLNPLNLSEEELFHGRSTLKYHFCVEAILAHLFVFEITSSLKYMNIKNNKNQDSFGTLIGCCNTIKELDLLTPKIFTRALIQKTDCSCCREFRDGQKMVFNFFREYTD